MCVCVVVGGGGGGGNGGEGLKCHLPKNLAWRFKSSSIHCSHNVYTGDLYIEILSDMYLLTEA